MRLFSLASCLLAAGTQAAVLHSPPTYPLSIPENKLVVRQNDSTPVVNGSASIAATGYWLADIAKQGRAAFNPAPTTYKVFRNVKDYGAKGDGVTDDSDAINRAISDGSRCGPWVCQSSTDSPALVYFPSGTYIIGKSVIVYYMTQLIGNPNGLPVLKATASIDGANGIGVIDASPYNNANGAPGWTSTNVFARQIRNFQIDMTAIPASKLFRGIHWPASQATSIQNVKVLMTQNANSQQEGIFVENGSGGHMTDLEIVGGRYGMNIGNQQFTMKNIKISNAVVGIFQIWNWGWLYKGLTITNCGTAFSMSNLNEGKTALQVGSVVIIDSQITNCPIFLDTAWTTGTKPIGAGHVILENIALSNVPVAVKGPSGTVLAGGTTTIQAWGQGNKYVPNGPTKFQGALTAVKRPAGLVDGTKYYSKSKPQYESLGVDSFISARTLGAKGDGSTDDTTALNNAIKQSASTGKVLFLDQGTYKVTNTIYVPPGAKIVGETYPVIMASGSTWGSNTKPVAVVRIGNAGESGSIELSDFLVATQGATPGAVLIEYNLNSARGSGVWDVHTRIGGAKGTNLQVAQCPINTVKAGCMAAHTNVRITKSGTGAYFENNWFWTADHDLDDPNSTRVAVFAGRGLLVEATNVWLYANGAEHHSLYQYQFANAKDIFAGFIQSETPYYMPTPDAKSQPYPLDSSLNDPDYNSLCPAGQICDAFGLRILNSQNILIYGAGIYSFFKTFSTDCSSDTAANGRRDCQNQIVSIEGASTSGITIYTLSEVGALQMLTIDKVDKALWSDNLSVYSNTIGLITYKV